MLTIKKNPKAAASNALDVERTGSISGQSICSPGGLKKKNLHDTLIYEMHTVESYRKHRENLAANKHIVNGV